jgi:hypothetical protein
MKGLATRERKNLKNEGLVGRGSVKVFRLFASFDVLWRVEGEGGNGLVLRVSGKAVETAGDSRGAENTALKHGVNERGEEDVERGRRRCASADRNALWGEATLGDARSGSCRGSKFPAAGRPADRNVCGTAADLPPVGRGEDRNNSTAATI